MRSLRGVARRAPLSGGKSIPDSPPPDFQRGMPSPPTNDAALRFRAEVMQPGESFTKPASSCPCHHKSRRRSTGSANYCATSIPSPTPAVANRCSVARAEGRPLPSTMARNPSCLRATQRHTRQVSPNKNPPLDCEQPEACLLASRLPRMISEHSPVRRRDRTSCLIYVRIASAVIP